MLGGVKTSSETAASALGGTETVRGVQAGSNVKITADQIKAWSNASPTVTGTSTHTGPIDISNASAGQIVFPASQNASANANTLDDYEEGTFTATLGDGTNNYTVNTQTSTYTKKGREVTVQLSGTWNSIGSAGAGQLRFGALPFTCSNALSQAAFIGSISGLDFTATLNPITAFVQGNTTNIMLERVNDNAAPTALAANGSSASGSFTVGAVYHV